MLSKNKAFEIAKKAISEKQQKSSYNDFSPVSFLEETEAFWTFVSGSEAMIEDGIIPGAFFVHIDKTDGHIWTRHEEALYHQRQSIPELQTA